MLRHILLASLAAPALLVGGCMGTQNRGVESVHQPVVDRASYALDLATRGGMLAPGEDYRLAGWMQGMHVGFGDRIAIDDPGDAAPGAHEQVAGVVARYGLLLSTDTPVTAAPVAPGVVRVVVSRMRAGVPGCPDWSRDSSTELDQHTSSNYGCAVNANLAAMVARPEDLVHGVDAGSVVDPALTSKAIDNYRKRPATGATGTLPATGGK
ncbi:MULTISPECIES: CpaD family pilus assembly lipoprotein [unclassified Sphingomonas]|jgi:pilus assembly protein CpaD|nr:MULTISPECIES: CpaD family pilus assembly lipoprotein [unclassified Sphingomonas]AXJ94685.1 pilus assembly protein CpaD [Sphingomonas sp. FARSPH]